VGFRKTINNILNKDWRKQKYQAYRFKKELKRITKCPRFVEGYAYIFDKPFKFHDNLSFIATYEELFLNDIYRFKPSPTANTILDCGANMGLSVLYFALNYPDHKIIAFEPEEHIFNILQENVKTFGLKNVHVNNKAVWDKFEQLHFYTDNGMGGRVNLEYKDQKAQIIDAVPLLEFITEDVDFLKIDIEGAEDVVLRSCAAKLHKVNNLFFEYHNNIDTNQTLDELLQLVKTKGFSYYVKESAVRNRPFVDNPVICERFDMALNVFCYKNT
jgi:FkbM family methyltransferase